MLFRSHSYKLRLLLLLLLSSAKIGAVDPPVREMECARGCPQKHKCLRFPKQQYNGAYLTHLLTYDFWVYNYLFDIKLMEMAVSYQDIRVNALIGHIRDSHQIYNLIVASWSRSMTLPAPLIPPISVTHAYISSSLRDCWRKWREARHV